MNKPLPLSRLLTFLGLAILSGAAASAPAPPCAVVSTDTVATTFGDPKVRLDMADPLGLCMFALSNGASLSVSAHKRPTVAEAGQLYDHFLATGKPQLQRAVAHPAIGQRAFVGISAAGAEEEKAELLSLQGDTLLVLDYYIGSSDAIESGVTAQLETLARAASTGRAVQSFDKCEWIAQEHARALLGSGDITIQRLGPRHCTAALANGAAIAVETLEANVGALASMRSSRDSGCKVVALPEFGAQGHASYACREPGSTAMTIQLSKKGTYAAVIFSPQGRAATVDDLAALKKVARHAYDRLAR